MYLLKGIKESDERLRVTIIYNLDAPENKDIDQTDGVVVQNEPVKPNRKRGISNVLYVNPKTGEYWYEEVERPLTQEEMLEEQNEKLDLITMALLEQEGIL
jgi:hypothetical protein